MSSLPFWIPITPKKKNSLPSGIKYPLARKYMDHDGSLTGKTELSHEDIPYLEGLRDAGNEEVQKGASILIEAIEKYDCILFSIEC